MAIRTWNEKLDVVMAIRELIMYHWKLNGRNIIPHDDEAAWEDIIHSRTNQDWWDVIDTAEIITKQYAEYMGPYGRLKIDIEDIKKRLMFAKDITRPKQHASRHYNTPAWRLLMAYKDLLNDIEGMPTPQAQPVEPVEDPTQFERLFNT
jgi:hypothetical protein